MYLKHNVKLAPYLWNWYAWSQLMPPHNAAMNIVGRHIKIMESFVAYPDMHYEAINSKGMVGGPFINISPQQKPLIQQLLESTKSNCAELIKLNDAIHKLSFLLQQADGASLEQLYRKIPPQLEGMVELVYDLSNNPQVRFVEPLLYQKYYSVKNQCVTLSQITRDNRPFCLSTPYIGESDALELKLPFFSPVIDTLMKMKSVSGKPDNLIEELKLSSKELPLYYDLFTEAPPPAPIDREFTGSGVRIRYFGHACVLMQTKDVSVLIDPVLGYNYDGKRTDRFSYLDLPDTIDYVFITHNHQDHFLFEVLLQLRHKIKTIVVPDANYGSLIDPSMKLILQNLGFNNVMTLSHFDDINFDGGCITALPFLGEHGDLDIRSKLAYHVQLQDVKCLFSADSNNLDNKLYDYIFRKIGEIDMLFIGMECVGAPASWLYGPLFSSNLSRSQDNSRRLSGSDYPKAFDIVKQSACKEVCVYAMGMEPWLSYIMAVDYQDDSPAIIESNKLVQECRKNHIQANQLYGKYEWLFPAGKYQVNEPQQELLNYAI